MRISFTIKRQLELQLTSGPVIQPTDALFITKENVCSVEKPGGGYLTKSQIETCHPRSKMYTHIHTKFLEMYNSHICSKMLIEHPSVQPNGGTATATPLPMVLCCLIRQSIEAPHICTRSVILHIFVRDFVI